MNDIRFYLNEHGLRMLNHSTGQGWYLGDDGAWIPYSGYDTWPKHTAVIEYRFTGIKEEELG